MDQDRFDPPNPPSRDDRDIGQYLWLGITLLLITAAAVVLSGVQLRPEPSPRPAHSCLVPLVPAREPKSAGRAVMNADGAILEWPGSRSEAWRTLGPKDPPKDPKGPGQGRPAWDGGAR